MIDPGPYMNDEGDWMVPVEGVAYLTARRIVRDCVDSQSRLAYKGREMMWLDSRHEAGCGDECEFRRRVLAWHFVESGW